LPKIPKIEEISAALHPGLRSALFSQMGKITTHVLDTAAGIPAAGVRVRLLQNGSSLAEAQTNSDGRCPAALLAEAAPGTYELVFSMGDYFRARGTPSAFLDEIPIRFLVEPGRDHHVPLACSPYAYSTYRGS
jgi:5-hydroxyisourate hydrolase